MALTLGQASQAIQVSGDKTLPKPLSIAYYALA